MRMSFRGKRGIAWRGRTELNGVSPGTKCVPGEIFGTADKKSYDLAYSKYF